MSALATNRRFAATAVVAGIVLNPLPLIVQPGTFAEPLRLLAYSLWLASPWLVLAASLPLANSSSRVLAVHATTSTGLVALSLIVFALTVIGSSDSMSWVFFLGYPLFGLLVALVVLVACLVQRRSEQ